MIYNFISTIYNVIASINIPDSDQVTSSKALDRMSDLHALFHRFIRFFCKERKTVESL